VLQDFKEANAHIYFDEDTAALKCKTCIQAGVDNSFTEGCIRITKQAVKEHFQGSSNNSHHAACERVASRAGLQSAVEKQQIKVQGAHVPLARTVLWMCVCMLPLALIGGLVGLQVANGSTQLAQLRGTYCNPHMAKEYAGVFSNMLDDALIADLQKSPWFAVLVDESTDVAVEKHLAVYVRYMSPDMRPVERFLQLTELTKSDAATIHASLVEVLEDRGLSMHKLVGFGSDGASVMTGEQTGVGARLKHGNPYITTMHCIAHRAALAAQDVFGSVEYAKWVDSVLGRVYAYFSRSGPRLQALAEVQQSMDLPELRIPAVHAVRWLSRDNVISAITRSYAALLNFFGDEAKSGSVTAVELVRDLGLTRHFVMVYCCQDVVHRAAVLSKLFQGGTFSFVKVSDNVQAFIKTLEKHYIVDGCTPPVAVRDVMEHVKTLNAARGSPKELDIDPNNAQAGLVERDLSDILNDCKAVMRDIASKYVAAIKARFPSLSLLDNFDIFNPTRLKMVDGNDANTFGDTEFENLAEFYGTARVVGDVSHAPLLDAAQLKAEWPQARLVLLRKAARLGAVTSMKVFLDFYAMVLLDLADICPVVCSLIMIMLCIPAHTAEVERGFSIQNLIKSKFRACLKVATLDTLMRVKLLGPRSIDDDGVANTAIDLEAATVKWQALKNRNPSKSNAGVTRSSRKPVHTLEEDFAFEANEA
jgi:hypothetical protein